MRHLTIPPTLFLALFVLPTQMAFADEPGYSCKPELGCNEIQGPAYDVGRGALLALPHGWKVYSYPTAPDPIMAGLREIRAVSDGLIIAISPFPNIDHREFSQATLCDMMDKAGKRYASASKEQTVAPVPVSRDGYVSCQVSFSAKNDGEKPFGVLPNRRHASVTTLVVAYKRDVVFSVSVVSERQPDEAYLAAVEAIRQIQ